MRANGNPVSRYPGGRHGLPGGLGKAQLLQWAHRGSMKRFIVSPPAAEPDKGTEIIRARSMRRSRLF
jgi:hypothetical protein